MGVSGCRPATSLSDWATRSTSLPGMTRFGLLPRRISRPSINPYFRKCSEITVAIDEGANVDSKMMRGTLPLGLLRSASARSVNPPNRGP